MRRVRTPAVVAAVLAAAFLVTFATLSILRYAGYHTRSFDLAIVERMLWGIRHGELREVFTGQPWIAYHFEPILLPLAVVDGVLPGPEGLLVVQSLALALAAIPAWRIGARVLGGDGGGLVGAVCALAYPVLGQTAVFELHPVALAVAPALWLVDALAARRAWQAIVAGILVCACREDGFLVVAFALAADGLTGRRAAIAAACVAAYAVWALVVSPGLGTVASARAHFGWLGATPAEIVSNAVRHPGRVLEHLWARRVYVLELLAPLAFLPLLAPRRLLVALPTVGLNLLSSLPDATRIVDCHYSALAAPGLIAAALWGAGRLAGWTRPWVGRALVVGAAAFGTAVWGAAPGMGGHHAELYTLDDRAAALDELVAAIPPDASVSVPADVVAHVARRETVQVFPRGLPGVDVALVDVAPRPVRGLPPEVQRERARAALRAAVSDGYRIVREAGALVLLAR